MPGLMLSVKWLCVVSYLLLVSALVQAVTETDWGAQCGCPQSERVARQIGFHNTHSQRALSLLFCDTGQENLQLIMRYPLVPVAAGSGRPSVL